MAERKNPIIGHWTCPNGSRAEVSQTARRGAALAYDCGNECCGYTAPPGRGMQQDIWDNALWLPGATVRKPSKVVDTPEKTEGVTIEQPKQTEKVTAPAAQASADFDPSAAAEESEAETVTETKPRRWGGFIAAGVGVAAIVVGVVTS